MHMLFGEEEWGRKFQFLTSGENAITKLQSRWDWWNTAGIDFGLYLLNFGELSQ